MPVIGNSQNFIIPTLYLDSLLFETSKYRVCDSVARFQQDEINKLGVELVHTNKALQLSQKESRTLEGLLTNSKENQELITKQFNLDRQKLKRKVKKRGAVILGETIAIIGLILLL